MKTIVDQPFQLRTIKDDYHVPRTLDIKDKYSDENEESKSEISVQFKSERLNITVKDEK